MIDEIMQLPEPAMLGRSLELFRRDLRAQLNQCPCASIGMTITQPTNEPIDSIWTKTVSLLNQNTKHVARICGDLMPIDRTSQRAMRIVKVREEVYDLLGNPIQEMIRQMGILCQGEERKVLGHIIKQYPCMLGQYIENQGGLELKQQSNRFRIRLCGNPLGERFEMMID